MMSYSGIPRQLNPTRVSTCMESLPRAPDLVVMITTPLAPRAPYRAEEAASLSTLTDSISLLLIALKLPAKGTPSTIMRGLLLALIEPIPRIRILLLSPGCPVEVEICTPETLPSSALATSVVCLFCISSAFTVAIEPVKDFLSAVPQATATFSNPTSSSTSGNITTFRWVFFPTFTSCVV